MPMNDIQEKIRAGAKVVAVRSPEEYAEGFFDGAINIPVNDIPFRLVEFGPKETPVVLYCASGSRAAIAEIILKARGYLDVVNAGGIADMPAQPVSADSAGR